MSKIAAPTQPCTLYIEGIHECNLAIETTWELEAVEGSPLSAWLYFPGSTVVDMAAFGNDAYDVFLDPRGFRCLFFIICSVIAFSAGALFMQYLTIQLMHDHIP